MIHWKDSKSAYQKPALLLCFFVGVAALIVYTSKAKLSEPTATSKISEPKGEKETSKISMKQLDWNNVNFKEKSIPAEVLKAVPDVNIKTGQVQIKNTHIFYRRADPIGAITTGQNVLLLHGGAFKSETWEKETKTLQFLSAMGHTAVGIDLPGYGNSPSADVDDRVDFLLEVMEKLRLDHPVVVSPSMSGSWSVPLITTKPDSVSGYVPVAPGHTGEVSDATYQSLKVPTLIVYGELDKGGERTSIRLSKIPTSKVYMLPGARHPAYLDQKDLWHQLLYNFLQKIQKSV